MRCPACDASAPAGAEACPQGHPLRDERGIFVLLSRPRREEVSALEGSVTEWRASSGRVPLPASALPELPFGAAIRGDHEWRLRRHDLRLVERLLAGRSGATILDVGAWNGWLSNRLTALGHDVTAADVFAGGGALGAPWPSEPRWRRVQVDPTELDRLEETFDVVILDRCLQFLPDPAQAVAGARRLLAPGGSLIATGLMIHRATRGPASRVAAEADAFRHRFGRELFLHPAKGFLDRGDLERLEVVGLRTRPYEGLRLANLRARLDRSRPEHRYGTAPR